MIGIEDFETNIIYRHFKGDYYYVMDLAEHTETNELMVVYHALYNDYECYVRPFTMFVEELGDVEKLLYKQEYRFCTCNDEQIRRRNDKMRYKPTIVVSAFPACSKSHMFKNFNEKPFTMLDSDSSQFSWIKDENGVNTKERNPDFPSNYIKHIKDNIEKVDVIFVSSH